MRSIIVVLLFGVTAAASGDDMSKKPSSDEMKQMMESSMGAMVPMMARMSEAMIEAQLNAAEKPETARRIAQFKKNLYDEPSKTRLLEESGVLDHAGHFTAGRIARPAIVTPMPLTEPGRFASGPLYSF
jgi:hypothetical protein